MVGQARPATPDRLPAVAISRLQISANDLVFDALASGPRDGELVLLLHGFPQSAEIWRPALRTLGDAGFRAVAPNQRGYSQGACPEEVLAYRVSELADDVRLIAERLGRRRFHVIGHDWGGTVAWALAAHAAASLGTVTAVATPHTRALAKALRGANQRARMAYIPVLRAPMLAEAAFTVAGGALAEALLMAAGARRADARRDVQHMLEVGPRGPLNWYRAIGSDGLSSEEPVDVPVLYIWGDRDPVFGREAAELTQQYVSGPYHLVELQGATHWIPDQHWDDVADLVLEHLRANPLSTRSTAE